MGKRIKLPGSDFSMRLGSSCLEGVVLLYFLHPEPLEILVRGVIKLREAGGVVGVAFRDADDHALARTSKKHSICV